MQQHIAVEIPSDDDGGGVDVVSPFPVSRKKKKTTTTTDEEQRGASAPLLILDDDFTPKKLSPTPSIVPETPFDADDVSIVKCTISACSGTRNRTPPPALAGISGLICLESDNESGGGSLRRSCCLKEDGTTVPHSNFSIVRELEAGCFGPSISSSKSCRGNDGRSSSLDELANEDAVNEKFSFNSLNERSKFPYGCGVTTIDDSDMELRIKDNASHLELDSMDNGSFQNHSSVPGTASIIQVTGDSPTPNDHVLEDIIPQSDRGKDNTMLEKVGAARKRKNKKAINEEEKKKLKDEEISRKKQLKEDRKLKREQEKLQKEAMKAEAVAMRKLQKERERWEKGKLAMKSIVAEIDRKVVETGSIGGHLLTRFAEKGLTFHVASNPIEKSILWKMHVPDEISELASKGSEVPYILLVYEAEEFSDLVSSDSLKDHVSIVQNHYPTYTICYLTNKLMAYINKRDQAHYKNPSNTWRRPPVDEELAKLATDFVKVHSRQCRDEAELAEHVVGLTGSLASCQFRKKLTRLSVNANGSLIPKDFIDKSLIKKSVWLKALIAIPKVQPRFAVAIWKKYPSLRALLNVYMDPSKSVHEKEFLLKDLTTEGIFGQDDRRVGEICSKRVYRILMAQNGHIKTDDVEDGADFFK